MLKFERDASLEDLAASKLTRVYELKGEKCYRCGRWKGRFIWSGIVGKELIQHVLCARCSEFMDQFRVAGRWGKSQGERALDWQPYRRRAPHFGSGAINIASIIESDRQQE